MAAEKRGGMLSALGEGVSNMLGSASSTSQVLSDKAMHHAISTMLSAVKFAARKIRESDEEIPPGSKLTVTANALLVEFSLEVPIHDYIDTMDEPDQDMDCPDSPERSQDGQDESRGPDEVV